MRMPAVLVLEDDALLHKQFGDKLKELLSTSARCSNYLRGNSSGGVLLLGATEWSLDAWNWIRDEVDTRVYDASAARCYNANLHTCGTFATMYHRDTYESILRWISVQLSSRKEPYDHVYQHLAANGTIVRVAYPYLAVADVGHASAVDPGRSQDVVDRSLRHEWNLSLYHEPVQDLVF
ncbi:hypothetical protein KFL_000950110 [Klebsormidium nitens]|uniref:Uncharacterized protein n=1 Tax=Klebsormidium nitens TaxID=105231 RepID=A0A1Y1HTI2_KLENI|nr:hypothetical protein KFL_000950110 [Klebsormidium nitens]|eukprot:GAQ81935.1 hypothetical protein KFL_000950110 [Klebsormidium nitens]